MFLGEINESKIDVRLRVNFEGKAEIVAKKGNFHVHDRTEVSQEINKNQIVGIVRVISLFGFQSKVTERENIVFDLGNSIYLTLVKAKNIFYIEIEKMSNLKEIGADKNKLLKMLSGLKLNFIKNEEEFNEVCDRLSKHSDWFFDGSEPHIKKLESLLTVY